MAWGPPYYAVIFSPHPDGLEGYAEAAAQQPGFLDVESDARRFEHHRTACGRRYRSFTVTRVSSENVGSPALAVHG